MLCTAPLICLAPPALAQACSVEDSAGLEKTQSHPQRQILVPEINACPSDQLLNALLCVRARRSAV